MGRVDECPDTGSIHIPETETSLQHKPHQVVAADPHLPTTGWPHDVSQVLGYTAHGREINTHLDTPLVGRRPQYGIAILAAGRRIDSRCGAVFPLKICLASGHHLNFEVCLSVGVGQIAKSFRYLAFVPIQLQFCHCHALLRNTSKYSCTFIDDEFVRIAERPHRVVI